MTGREAVILLHARLRISVIAILFSLLVVSLLAGCAPRVELVTVPEMAGSTSSEAQDLLREAGLELGETRETYDAAVPPGEIVTTAPPGAAELEKGSSVDITVSKGPEMVTVPSLIGTAEVDALAALQTSGFQAELQRAYDESVAAGLVCAMQPAPNTTTVYGSKVVMTVSQGSAYVVCETCGGDGDITATVTCPDCEGSGVCYT